MLLDDLTWTTREEVGARLLAYLQETRPPVVEGPLQPVYPTRERVAELLYQVATPELRDPLLKLVLDPDEECEVRRQALMCLRGKEASLSGEQLRLLLADSTLCEGPFDVWAADVLQLVETPEAQEVARTYFLALGVADRAALLPWLVPDGEGVGSAFSEWLYRYWLELDRHAFAADDVTCEASLQIIRYTLSRANSRRALQELWRSASGEARRELLEELYEERGDVARMWTFPDPLTGDETQELVQALALPTAELAAHMGRRRLQELLEQAWLEAERDSELAARTRKRVDDRDLYGSCLLLWHWCTLLTDEELAVYVLREGLPRELRWWTMEALWKRNRALAAGSLIAALRAGDRRGPRLFLRWSARTPVPDDEELLREAFRPEYPQELRYYGLCGLHRLPRAAQDWVEGLSGVVAPDAGSDIRLRLRAWGALARRGDAAALAELTVHAKAAEDLRVRAEALATVAESVPAAAWPLLAEAIRYTGPEYDLQFGGREFSPLAEEAALALTRVGSPEARTLLLRAYLRARTHGFAAAIEEYLAAALVSPSGGASPPLNLMGSWRKEVAWR